jgi:hypothetical protein
MKDDDIKIIEQMRDETLQLIAFDKASEANGVPRGEHAPPEGYWQERADALTNLLAEVIETRDMLAAADGVRLPGPLNCGIGLISLSDGWAIKNSPGCLGDTRYPTALEAYRAMKENV